MNVNFVGSDQGEKRLVDELSGDVDFVDYDSSNCAIIEIDSIDSLENFPEKFSMPTFFYITANKRTIKKIVEKISYYNIKGVLYLSSSKKEILDVLHRVMEGKKGLSQKHKEESYISKSKILAKAEKIPVLPVIASELIKLADDDAIGINQIVDKVKMDQGLTSVLLRLVNSSFYGIKQEIRSVEHASALLGLNNIKSVILTVSIREFYSKNFKFYKMSGMKMWMHSYNVARICDIVSKLRKDIDSNAMYLAGLMHDIGKTVLVDLLYEDVNNYEDEVKQTGYSHMDIGEIILTKWGIAKDIISAVKYHHIQTDKIFNSILYYANIIEGAHLVDDDIIFAFTENIDVDSTTLKTKIRVLKDETY